MQDELKDFINKEKQQPPSDVKIAFGHICFIFSMIFGSWFILTSWFWLYLINLYISYPFGVLAFILWLAGRSFDPRKKRYVIPGMILLVGLGMSLTVLLMIVWESF